MIFTETSALSGENVEEAFLKCARQIMTKLESGEIDAEGRCGVQQGATSLTNRNGAGRGGFCGDRKKCA
jgi:Ras-related protein Rab-4B